jgi:probable O-glycosylation ligase (exosortase A-associated)
VVGVVTSAVLGIALTRFPPAFVIGAVACALAACIILTRPFVGLLFYIILYMLRLGELYPPLAPLHAERVVGVLTLVSVYLEQYRTSRRILIDATRQTRLLLLFVVPILISVLFAYWRFRALASLIDFVKLIVLYLLVVSLLTTRLRLRIYLALFLALICFVAVGAFAGYFGGHAEFSMGIDRAVGSTDLGANANTLAATMAATIPILLVLTFYRRLRGFRFLTGAATLLLVSTAVLTGSRGGLLGLLGGLLFLLWRSRNRLLLGLVGVVILGAGVLWMPEQYKTRYSSIFSSTLDGSSSARLVTWGRGLRMIRDRPLTGVGLGCFGIANLTSYSPEGLRSRLVAHSLYIQVPSEVGLFGALVFFAFLFEVFRLYGRTAQRLRAAGPSWRFEAVVLQGLASGTFVLLITGAFGDNLLRHTWYVYSGMGVAIARLLADRSLGPGVASPDNSE